MLFGGFMLKKINRLTKRKEFGYIYKNGTKLNYGQLSVYFIKSRFPFVRFGISVNNKVGNAVVRNKIKRRLRSILHSYINIIKHKNVIVVAHAEAVNLSYQDLKKLVDKMFIKGKIISE